MKEKLHEFLKWRYGDTLSNILAGAGFLLLLYTFLVYLTEYRFSISIFLYSLIFLACGILYKELIYNKK